MPTPTSRERAREIVGPYYWEPHSGIHDLPADIAAAIDAAVEECAVQCETFSAFIDAEIAREQKNEIDLNITREEIIDNLKQQSCAGHRCAAEIRARGASRE